MSRTDDVELLEFVLKRLSMFYSESENTDYLINLKSLIKKTRSAPLRDRFVLVSESDTGSDNWMEGMGPIAHETYVGRSNAERVIELAESFGDRYGKQMICRLEPLGNLDEFKKAFDGDNI